ncbi:MAG: hypothetical protein KGJ72_14505, partial [Gammaproteobacteria bacterium]|nr:hypothetical protein [Gammaproteobacteria bacterium]
MVEGKETPSAASPAQTRSRTIALDAALPHLTPLATGREAGDGILFAGNPHESLPRALFLDVRLTPLERNAWAVIRLMLNEDGITAFPSYAQLRPFLASAPGSQSASDETVARALTVLRLTRWLSLARRRRDPTTGRLLGNLYVLHDEPLSPYEALKLDPDYLELVSRALMHASKTIQYLSCHVLTELTEDPRASSDLPRTRLEGLLMRIESLESSGMSRLNRTAKAAATEQDDTSPTTLQRRTRWEESANEATGEAPPRIAVEPSSETEEGAVPSSDSEDGTNSLKTGFLRNPKRVPTVRTVQYEDLNIKIRTVPRADACARVSLPERFARLKPEQQAGALAALQPLEIALQQAV